MKKYCLIFLIAFIFNPAIAVDRYYYVGYKYDTEKAITCDKYVRDNSVQFYDDMHVLVTTYQKKQYTKTKTILKKYGITKNNDQYMKNKFINSVFTCSAIYKFSGDVNYYREFMSAMTLFISRISYTVIDSLPHDNDVKKLHEQTNNYFNIVLSSMNKTANKALNSDAEKRRAR